MTQITDQLEINYVARYLSAWYSIRLENIISIDKECQEDYDGWKGEYYFITYTQTASDWHDSPYEIRVLVSDVDDYLSAEKRVGE